MTDDLISRSDAINEARRYRKIVGVVEPLWHEGQVWASVRIEEAIRALPAAQVQATPPAPDGLDALVERLRDADQNSIQRIAGSSIFSEAADAITALRARPATAQVKPLVWERIDEDRFSWKAPLFGEIQVKRHWKCPWVVVWSTPGYTEVFAPGRFPTPGEAKAAAEARIRAALVASEPADGCHQPPLPPEDAQQDSVDRATANRLIADLLAKLDAANADAERLVEALAQIDIGQSAEPDHWQFRCRAREIVRADLQRKAGE